MCEMIDHRHLQDLARSWYLCVWNDVNEMCSGPEFKYSRHIVYPLVAFFTFCPSFPTTCHSLQACKSCMGLIKERQDECSCFES